MPSAETIYIYNIVPTYMCFVLISSIEMAMARCSTAALFVIVFSATALSSTVSGQVTGGRLVGGEAAWNSPAFDYQAWADGITFHIGDELSE